MLVGLDRLPRSPSLVGWLRTKKVALLAHPASVDRSFRHVSTVLAELGVTPCIIFGPEHGYGGEAQDMIGVPDARDVRTGAPIVSLYGDTFDSLSPTAAQLDGVDVLLIDLADVGSRYYTFVWTALLAARAAARAGVHTLILDRPNPLGQSREQLEGRLPSAKYLSFVGLEPVPVRHGLTLGEIVCSFAAREGLALGASGTLSVLAVEGDDKLGCPGWNRPFILPSPNMPTYETALVYPGGCLIEGTNLSEGRGTTRPFELVGAPFVDGQALAARLAATRLPGFVARPVTFLPTFQKHARTVCGGVQIHVTDPHTFRPYATYVALTAAAHALAPDAFAFRTEKYEFRDDVPAFDLLTGNSDVREAILRGDPEGDIARWAAEVPEQYFAEWAEAAQKRLEASRGAE